MMGCYWADADLNTGDVLALNDVASASDLYACAQTPFPSAAHLVNTNTRLRTVNPPLLS